MVSYYKLILGILNAIVGCVAGTMLVILTGNGMYYIVNILTGFVSGALVAFAFQEKGD